MSDEPYQVIEVGHRYALGETPEGYEIRDRLAGDSLVERFSLTEEGIDDALARFDELKWEDRRKRWNLPRVARITTVSGALAWLISGTFLTLLYSFGAGPDSLWIARALSTFDAFGYRLAVGSLVALAVLVLLRWLHPGETRAASVGSWLGADSPRSHLEMALRGALVVGLAVWTVSSVATEALFRLELNPFTGDASNAAVASEFVSTMAFRTWVASLVLLVLIRAPIRRSAPTATQPQDG